jgi:hypothetical protein
LGLRIFRLLTVLLIALSMSVAMAHFLELPAKLRLDGATWLMMLQTIYPPAFGTAGAGFEVAALVFSIALAIFVRRRGSALAWTILGAACMAAAHAAFWIWVAPVNAVMVPASAATLPADWMALRDQWEHTHAIRAILQFLALAFMLASILIETPRRYVAPEVAAARAA